jgi:hypothetical protein
MATKAGPSDFSKFDTFRVPYFKTSPIFDHHAIVTALVVHLIPGSQRLRDMDCYLDDSMLKGLLGLNRLPDVVTVSRVLATVDRESMYRCYVRWAITVNDPGVSSAAVIFGL